MSAPKIIIYEDNPEYGKAVETLARDSGAHCAVSPGSASGFWRSPHGENHGRDSKPGDVWVEAGDFTDSDRMEWLEKRVRWNDPTNTAKIIFDVPTVPHCTLRDAIDAAIREPNSEDDRRRSP